ncbi:MAG: carbon monoxide dehydrogenase [Nitrospirae bacterium]|nr:MAG: carbon monoxide dehydrogenase [Nitrospirota bacterium]
MKIAITGKGGVGKTTLAAFLSYLYAHEGKRVIAVDADPDANLATAFGISREESAKIVPIAEMADLIEERTGAKPGRIGGMFKLNPKVDDIPEKVGVRIDGIRLLIMGKSKAGASGCYCPENVLLKRLLRHLVLERDEVIIADMEAGIEHLTRGTAEGVDAFIVVVEPGLRSIQTAATVKELAKDLGIKKLFVVANKVRNEDDIKFIKDNLPDITFLGYISFDPKIMEADMKGIPSYEIALKSLEEASEIKKRLEEGMTQ